MLCKARIRSLPELVPTAVAALATRSEQSADFYEIAKSHPSKRFLLYFEYPNSNVLFDQGEALLWNRQPYYSLNLIPRLTTRNTVMVGENVKVWGKFEDNPATAWNGLLEGTDVVTINIAASEESPSSDSFEVSNPEIKTLTLTNANEQYPLIIPDGTRRYYLKCRGDAGVNDVVADVRYSWVPGVVATRNGSYEILPADIEDGENNVYLVGKTLYLASSAANVVVTLKVWK
ncbi:hypothetical protein [Microcoleus sp. FACHB-672]|uniref:hypothetical protein n=1 Tax=Microcoleus sp. FACHB-672 TaxID=2692825 RepID=UPI0016890CE7|nr:hypothetical protein [Microcoleus sp. FACHB-672]